MVGSHVLLTVGVVPFSENNNTCVQRNHIIVETSNTAGSARFAVNLPQTWILLGS